MLFDSVINCEPGELSALINEELNRGSLTLFNIAILLTTYIAKLEENYKKTLAIQLIVEKLLSSLKEEDSLYTAISVIKHVEEECIIADFDIREQPERTQCRLDSILENKFATSDRSSRKIDAIKIRGGRFAYLIKSMDDFQRIVKEAKESLTARGEALNTFIFQFYVVEESRTKCRWHLPVATFVDLLLAHQQELVEQVGKYLFRVQESGRIQQTYVKDKEIDELMDRYVLSSASTVVCCNFDAHKLIGIMSELLSFLGLFKRTAILVDGLNYTQNVSRQITPIRLHGRLIINEDSKQLTPSSGSLPIIPEKHRTKSTVRGKKGHPGRATVAKEYVTHNPSVQEEIKRNVQLKRQLQSYSYDKASKKRSKVLESKREKKLMPRADPTQEVTVDYAIKNIYGAYSVKNILKKLRPHNCSAVLDWEHSSTSDRAEYGTMEYSRKDVNSRVSVQQRTKSTCKIDSTSRKYSATFKGIECCFNCNCIYSDHLHAVHFAYDVARN
eukprot:TRINITY_DN7611_c0_g1_i1.p1 TRINITY_DN7611_c0_g1~~TRINITY_DN7611_c0_g1_i1.p1  ORF type:complete len:501 (-),score=70.62 TRINITY_DN7611_c0_g1_i1:914-2416(-)